MLLAALLLTVTGCIYDKELESCTAYYDGDLSLLLNVSVLDSGGNVVASRASRADDYEFELPDLATEKLQTLRVIIVKDKDKVIVHNRFERFSEPDNSISTLRFKVEFSTAYTIYLIGNEAGLSEINYEELFNTALQVGKTYESESLESLESLTLDANYAGAPIIDNEGEKQVLPIPMSEKFKVTTIERPLQGPEENVLTMEKSFFLTRAASKFTFNFYKSADYTNVNPMSVKKVKITGLGKNEYLLPNGTVYNPDKELESENIYGGRLITDFKVPDGTPLGEYEFTLPDLGDVSKFPVAGNGVSDKTFSPQLYFPESLGNTGADKFQCSISFDGETYLPLVTLPNLPILPRNTHVIVNVTIGNNNALLLNVKVQPWVPEYYEFDFTHNVGIADDGALEFTPDTYASLDKKTGRLVLNDYPKATIGTFGISEPIGARWSASLVTTSGELNAIQFQVTDENGNTSTTPHISGIIDGKKTSFKVVATQKAGAEQSTAVLQVIVTLLDGLSVPVNILKSTEYEKVENITFIQNPQ